MIYWPPPFSNLDEIEMSALLSSSNWKSNDFFIVVVLLVLLSLMSFSRVASHLHSFFYSCDHTALMLMFNPSAYAHVLYVVPFSFRPLFLLP